MRLALLLPVLFCVAAPAYAEGARESRYGPTTPRQASAAAAARYDGPMLGWANKRQPQAVAPAPATSAPAQPAPVAAWAGYQPQPASMPPSVAPQATPTSLYAPPRPAPAAAAPAQAPAPTKDWSTYRSARVAPAPPPPQPVATASGGAAGARFYSVDRDYGLTPDAAPRPGPDNRVLVAATEPPPEPKDAVPMHGSADWLAAGARGDDDNDDDSAARRAKTRNEGL